MTVNITWTNPLDFLIDKGNDKYLIREMEHILSFLSYDLIYDLTEDFDNILSEEDRKNLNLRYKDTYKKLYIVENRKKILKAIITIQRKFRNKKKKLIVVQMSDKKYLNNLFPTNDQIIKSKLPKELFDALNECIINSRFYIKNKNFYKLNQKFTISDFHNMIYKKLNINYDDLYKMKYLKILKYYKKNFIIKFYKENNQQTFEIYANVVLI